MAHRLFLYAQLIPCISKYPLFVVLYHGGRSLEKHPLIFGKGFEWTGCNRII